MRISNASSLGASIYTRGQLHLEATASSSILAGFEILSTPRPKVKALP